MSRRATAPAPPRNPTMRLLGSHARRHWGALAGAAASTVALTLAQLAAPWPLKIAIDELVTGRGTSFELTGSDVSLLLGLAAMVLGIAVVDALATYFSDFWLNRSGEQIVHDLRTATYEHLQRLSLVFHSNRPTGDLVARVTGDVNAVGDLFAQTLGTLASSSLVLVGMFAVTFWIDPLLAFVAFLVTPLLLATTMHYQKRIRQMARKQRAKEGEIASLATEALSAMQVIKAFGTERFEHDRVQLRSAERLQVGVESSRVEARFGALVDVLGAVATALVLGLGVLSVADGRISPGDLVVVVAYTNKLYKPLKDIAKQSSRAARALARLERIAEILSSDMVLADGTDGSTPDHRAAGTIELDDVHFRYTEERAALDGVTLHVPHGSRLALVGESGAGKSTVGALIARFYDPSHGSVRVDGRDARELSAALGARPGRCAAAGHHPVQRQRPGQHRLRHRRRPRDGRGRRPGCRRAFVHRGPARRLRHPARPRGRGPLRRPAPTDRHRAGPSARSPGARAGRADHRSGRRERGAGDGRTQPPGRGTHDDPDHAFDRAGPHCRPRCRDGRWEGRRVRRPGAAPEQGLDLPHADLHPATTRPRSFRYARVARGARPRRQEGGPPMTNGSGRWPVLA